MPITSVNGSERGQAEAVCEINEHFMEVDKRLFSVGRHLYCWVLSVAFIFAPICQKSRICANKINMIFLFLCLLKSCGFLDKRSSEI